MPRDLRRSDLGSFMLSPFSGDAKWLCRGHWRVVAFSNHRCPPTLESWKYHLPLSITRTNSRVSLIRIAHHSVPSKIAPHLSLVGTLSKHLLPANKYSVDVVGEACIPRVLRHAEVEPTFSQGLSDVLRQACFEPRNSPSCSEPRISSLAPNGHVRKLCDIIVELKIETNSSLEN